MSFDVAAEIQIALLEHLEDFLGEVAPFHVFVADRHQADGRLFILEDMPGVNRAHDRVFHHVFRSRVAVGAGVDQNKDICF